MNVLGNYIKLVARQPKTLKISRYYIDAAEIKDPGSNIIKTINRLVCVVTRENGKEVTKKFIITSEKLARLIYPGLQKDLHLEKEVKIIRTGRGYKKKYSLEWM